MMYAFKNQEPIAINFFEHEKIWSSSTILCNKPMYTNLVRQHFVVMVVDVIRSMESRSELCVVDGKQKDFTQMLFVFFSLFCSFKLTY